MFPDNSNAPATANFQTAVNIPPRPAALSRDLFLPEAFVIKNVTYPTLLSAFDVLDIPIGHEILDEFHRVLHTPGAVVNKSIVFNSQVEGKYVVIRDRILYQTGNGEYSAKRSITTTAFEYNLGMVDITLEATVKDKTEEKDKAQEKKSKDFTVRLEVNKDYITPQNQHEVWDLMDPICDYFQIPSLGIKFFPTFIEGDPLNQQLTKTCSVNLLNRKEFIESPAEEPEEDPFEMALSAGMNDEQIEYHQVFHYSPVGVALFKPTIDALRFMAESFGEFSKLDHMNGENSILNYALASLQNNERFYANIWELRPLPPEYTITSDYYFAIGKTEDDSYTAEREGSDLVFSISTETKDKGPITLQIMLDDCPTDPDEFTTDYSSEVCARLFWNRDQPAQQAWELPTTILRRYSTWTDFNPQTDEMTFPKGDTSFATGYVTVFMDYPCDKFLT